MRWIRSIILCCLMLGWSSVAMSATQSSARATWAPPRIPTEFSSLENGWLRISYHPSLNAKVDKLVREAPGIKDELAELLRAPVLEHVDVVIGRTPGEMETLAPADTRFPRYASGVAFSERHLVLLTDASRYPGQQHDLVEVFRHELAHVALSDALGSNTVPRWFNEGFAVHASKEAETARLQTLWTATLAEQLIPLERLATSFPEDAETASIAYAEAADIVRFLLRNDDAHRFASLIERLGKGQEFSRALSDAYSSDLFSLEKEWQKDVARRYTFWPVIFGGSFVWAGALGLLVFAYMRKRRQARDKLAVWAKEEAVEDARKRLAQAVLAAPGGWNSGSGPVRILVATAPLDGVQPTESQPGQDRAATAVSLPAGYRDALRPVPTIEHEGRRHILH